MACAGCGGARAALGAAVRSGSIRGAVGAVRMGMNVIRDKARGTYSDANYRAAQQQQQDQAGTPYRRPERTR